jgi:hypothetical protein
MDNPKENLQAVPVNPLLEDSGNIDTLSGSHQMTLTGYPKVEGDSEDFSNNPIRYHLTAYVTNESLTRRELSLLLDVLNYQALTYGININMRIAMYELYFRLLGNKRNTREIMESKIRLTLVICEIILQSLAGFDNSLSATEFIHLSPDVVKLLKSKCMTARTYGSRFKTWRPEKLIKIKAVPVDIQMENQNRPNRYSSYCKGYGESHPSTHRKRTMPSQELDGNGTNFLQSEEHQLFKRCTEPDHVLCEFLILKYENEIRKKT